MICHKPLTAWKQLNGTMTFNEKEAIGQQYKLPCAQCMGCRLEKSRQWAIRSVHESQLHERNCFITLTYADMPKNKSLNKKHLQDFWKRLRKSIYPKKIRYFACGEYGDSFNRPHYHAIIFGYDFGISDEELTPRMGEISKFYPQKKLKTNSDLTIINKSDYGYLWTSNQLNKIWKHGFTSVAECSFETCAYVARYVTKKITGTPAEKHYEIMDEHGELSQKQKEFAAMSRNPGIGAKWLRTFHTDVYNTGHCLHDKRKLKIPPYYDKWLEKNNPELYDQVKSIREEFIHSDMDYNDFYQKISVAKSKHNRQSEQNLKLEKFPDLDNNILDHYKHLRRLK